MKCRSCGTEIADKAIVCFRCGTPTAVTPPVSKRVQRRRPPVWLLVPILLLIVLNVWFLPRVTVELWPRVIGWVLAVVVVAVVARLARR